MAALLATPWVTLSWLGSTITTCFAQPQGVTVWGKEDKSTLGFADTPRKKLFFPLGAQVCLRKPEDNTGKAAESSYREKQIPNTHFESWDLPRPERVADNHLLVHVLP